MLIYLLRHGRTVSPGTYSGVSDIELSVTGEQQVREIASFLSAIPFDACYSSPLLRCRKTFELLDIPVSCTYDERLREIDFGRWEGCTFSQVCQHDQENVSKWIATKEHFIFPGGDSIVDFTTRVTTWFDRLVTIEAKTVLIVAHGGVIKKAICHLLDFGQDYGDCFEIKEAGITLLKHDNGFSTLAGLNCTG